jgi:hypothetical protein
MARRLVLTRSCAAALAMLGLAAPVATGCLDDLPAPLSCPPDAGYKGSNCVPALIDVVPGCLTLEQMACLSGPRTTCTCIADECPVPEETCYPEGDCPAEVTTSVSGSPSCLRLAPRDIGAGLPSESQCLCGCGGCMAVCDGKGPVLGVTSDGNVPFAPLAIDVSSYMPDSGRLGVFVRERGLAGALLAVMKGEPPNYEIGTYYYIESPIGTAFTSQVFYDDPFLGTSDYRWEKAADKPQLLVIFVQGTADLPVTNLMEIDCVIPFLLPN